MQLNSRFTKVHSNLLAHKLKNSEMLVESKLSFNCLGFRLIISNVSVKFDTHSISYTENILTAKFENKVSV